jgi:hypothetical protein
MSACWIAVASAEHVRRGRSEGFMQVSHGKAAPLKRIKPGDRVVYYSPTVALGGKSLGGKDKLQAFTAIGTVKDREPYVFDMGKVVSRLTAATLHGRRPKKRRSARCSTDWNSRPASRTGVINCALGCFRSARPISD